LSSRTSPIERYCCLRLFGRERMQKKAMKEEQGLLKESGYSDKAIKLYLDKVNVGVLEKPSIVARALYLAVDENHAIEDARSNVWAAQV